MKNADAASLSSELRDAVDELRATFPDADVRAVPDGSGGCWIIIDTVEIGVRWDPAKTWIGFHLAANYPYADVYPLFIDAACRLVESGGLPEAVTAGAAMPGVEGQCLQVSRKSNRWNPIRDTAAQKLLNVIDWLATR